MMVIKFKHNNTHRRAFVAKVIPVSSFGVSFACKTCLFLLLSLFCSPFFAPWTVDEWILGKEEGRGFHSMYTHMSLVRALLEFCLPFSATEHKKNTNNSRRKQAKNFVCVLRSNFKPEEAVPRAPEEMKCTSRRNWKKKTNTCTPTEHYSTNADSWFFPWLMSRLAVENCSTFLWQALRGNERWKKNFDHETRRRCCSSWFALREQNKNINLPTFKEATLTQRANEESGILKKEHTDKKSTIFEM